MHGLAARGREARVRSITTAMLTDEKKLPPPITPLVPQLSRHRDDGMNFGFGE
jgi:hypothetical protein